MRYPDRSSHRVFNLTRNRNRKKTIYPGFIGFLTNQQNIESCMAGQVGQ
jgi:hypothetical protein